MKCYKDQSGNTRPAEEGEYSFAKFNKKVRSPRLLSLGWSPQCLSEMLSLDHHSRSTGTDFLPQFL